MTYSTSVILDMYPKRVNAICDPNQALVNSSVGYLLEIQTCWVRVTNAGEGEEDSSGGVKGR